MDTLRITLTLATLLSSLVAGFLIAFTLVVMPGIRNLSDYNYLQAFKLMDQVIQNNQPVFILIWLGSIVAIIAATGLGITQLNGLNRLLLIIAAVIYLTGVQLPTATVNIPLNNQLQARNLQNMSELALSEARNNFEPRWVLWNTIRTIFAAMTSVIFILLILRL